MVEGGKEGNEEREAERRTKEEEETEEGWKSEHRRPSCISRQGRAEKRNSGNCDWRRVTIRQWKKTGAGMKGCETEQQ